MGLFAKTIIRNKIGKKRLEDKTDLDIYLETVEWIDLGHDVLYAKHDFPLDKGLLSINDINNIIQNLPKDISIMNKNQFRWIQDNCKIIKYQNDKFKKSSIINSICCVNDYGDIHFNLPLDMSDNQSITYFLKVIKSTTYKTLIEINEIGPKKFPSYLGTTKTISKMNIIGDNNISNKEYNIKLVKLKK